MKHIATLFLILLITLPVFATPDSSPINWKLSGRLFLDGGVYIHSPEALHAGAHISDVRLAQKSVSIPAGIPRSMSVLLTIRSP